MKTFRMNQWIGSRTAVAGAILGGTAAIAGCTADMGRLPQGGTEAVGTDMSAISTPGWTATWGVSPQASGQSFAANTTVRQTVHASISGSSLRLQLSNAFGNQAVTITNVHVAKPTDNSGATVDLSTAKAVTFGGQTSVTIAAGQTVASDAVSYAVTALQDVTVTFLLPQGSGPSTYHWLSSQSNYSAGGDQTGSASLSGSSTWTQYDYLMAMDVQNSAATGAIVTFGASITDGYTTAANANQRWPDDLAVRIHTAGLNVGVLNAGISGNQLLADNSWGPSLSAEHRFSNDVANQSGIKWVVFSDDPINDMGSGQTNGSALITGYQQIITDAHNAGLKIVCSTLTPFQGAGGWSAAGETARGQINSFVRGSGSGCDAVLDQDTATHNPSSPTWFLPAYDSGDHIHPNTAGYQAIANAFNLSILGTAPPPTESPYGGTAWAIPGVIEAENYDLGGEGLAYHDNEPANLGGQYRLSDGVDIETCTDTGGGYDVGWTNNGEWMKYTVNVASSGTYNLNVRATCNSGVCTMQMNVDGTNVTGTMTLAVTGGWQTWADNTKTGISLTAGQHVIQIQELSGGFNLNKFTVTLASGGSLFSTGLESGQTQPTWSSTIDWSSNVTGYTSGINPECAVRTGEQAHTGSAALMYSGSAAGAASDYVYFKVFSVNMPISSTSVLDYWIYPQQDNGRYVAVDFHCTDGTTLRDSGAVDQNGFSVHPNAGHGGNIPLNAWSEVRSTVGSKLAGKTVDKIWVAYDRANSTGQLRGYIDDISVSP